MKIEVNSSPWKIQLSPGYLRFSNTEKKRPRKRRDDERIVSARTLNRFSRQWYFMMLFIKCSFYDARDQS